MKEKIQKEQKVVTRKTDAELRQRLILGKLNRAKHYIEAVKRLERDRNIAL